MYSIADLMAITESGTGFVGTSNYDAYPHLSLTEATAGLCNYLAEAKVEFMEMASKQNDALVEAAVNGIRYGSMSESAVAELDELSFKEIKAKVIAFFDKILKFIQSILSKIKTQIDIIRMKGKQLWTTYKTQVLNNTEKYKDFTYEGYPFETKVTFTKASSSDADGGASLIKTVLGNEIDIDAFAAKVQAMSGTGSDDDAKATSIRGDSSIEQAMSKIKDMSNAEIESKMANQLTGLNLNEDGWKEELRKELFGDKETMKYGEDGFTADKIGRLCSEPQDLDKIAKEYEAFKKGVEKHKKEVEKKISDAEKTLGKDSTSQVDRAKISITNEYMKAYIDAVNCAVSAISEVKNIRTSYAMTMNAQAKAVLAKLINLSGKKVKKEDADMDDDFLDLEIE